MMQPLEDTHYVRVGPRQLTVLRYDPESENVVVLGPSDMDTSGPYLGSSMQRTLGKGEYEPVGDPESWTLL